MDPTTFQQAGLESRVASRTDHPIGARTSPSAQTKKRFFFHADGDVRAPETRSLPNPNLGLIRPHLGTDGSLNLFGFGDLPR